jgi:hypothetical protein
MPPAWGEVKQRPVLTGNLSETTNFQAEAEKLQLEIILRFIDIECRKHRRCKQIRCRRSGRCAEKARTLRKAPRKAGPSAPKPPRRRALLKETLPDRARNA